MGQENAAVGFNAKIIDLIKTDFPKFHITSKDLVWHQRLLGYLMFWMWRWPKGSDGKRKWESLFMTRYTTTMGYGLYVSDISIIQHRRYWWTMAHEFVHMSDMAKSPFLYTVSYLAPQVFSVFAIAAIGSIWVDAMLWLLAFIALAAPVPSIGRMRIEFRGYTMSLACRYWETGRVSDDDIAFVTSQFTGPSYYFMWPFRKHITSKFQDSLRQIESGEILSDEVFRKVHDTYRLHEEEQ